MSLVADRVAPEPTSDHGREDPAPRRLLAFAVAIGVVLEVGLRGGVANAVVVTGIVLTVHLLWTDHRLERREARVVAAASLVPALFLGVRASAWLAWSNAVAVVALLTLAVTHARSGSILDSGPAQLLRRAASGLSRGVGGLSIVTSVTPKVSTSQRDGLLRVGRGLAVVVPVLLVLVALLASADAVFASFLSPELDTGPAIGHVALAALLASLVVVLAHATWAEDDESSRQGTFGAVEISTMLGLVAAVLGLFVISQLVALTDAGDRLIQSAGLTPAEYARSGFFQLCWATGLLLAFLAFVRALADPSAWRSRPVVTLSATVPVLALGLVIVSLRRMAFYDEVFGLTMLRLWVVGAAIWMGSVLLMVAARNLGVGSNRQWLVAGASLAGLALVVVANVMNPEAFVARRNVDRASEGAELDIDYLSGLSDDVLPVVTDAIDDQTDPIPRGDLLVALRCGEDADGVAALNLAARRASGLRAGYCAP